MLLSVPGAKSCDGLPAMVTRPGFLGCLYCRWLPRVATCSQPSASINSMASRTFTGRPRWIFPVTTTVPRFEKVGAYADGAGLFFACINREEGRHDCFSTAATTSSISPRSGFTFASVRYSSLNVRQRYPC